MQLKIGTETVGMLRELVADQSVFQRLERDEYRIRDRSVASVEKTVQKLVYELEDHLIASVHEQITRRGKRAAAMAMLAALVAVQEHLGAHFDISK